VPRRIPASIPTRRNFCRSISTLEDCYRPDLVPSDDELRSEHSERIRHLVECGVDLILIETINTIREVVIMAKLANHRHALSSVLFEP
jgi:methionine synthase I (cobalamin-dependent)